ncbi:MAG: ATP synthase F0 subunit B [Acidobacteriota bacterium]|nr:ATP synthase F0 subunit B [Acidobacteriota bacterium]
MLALALLAGGALVPGAGARSFGPAGAVSLSAAQAGAAEAAATHEEGGHDETVLQMLARLANFLILAGALVYLLRSPFSKYLEDRRTQIRADLVNADEMRRAAAERLQEIDRRMQTLPGELEQLKVRGAEEIAAEEARIDRAAAAERERLLEQARREIDLQLRVAQRELVTRAAELSVDLATQRIKRTITDADQLRLVDRYLDQLDTTRGAR